MPIAIRLTLESVDLDGEDETDEFWDQVIAACMARVRLRARNCGAGD